MSDRSEAYGDSHITIPPEALEASAREIAKYDGWGFKWDAYSETARAACLAMLAHWPGKHVGPSPADARRRSLILPLPKENTNAEG